MGHPYTEFTQAALRKCTMRFLFVPQVGDYIVITQDMRRKRRIVTGRIVIGRPPVAAIKLARLYRCNFIVRQVC